jgi:RNA-directed DNA polymerase
MGFQRQAVLKLLIYMIQQSQEIRESHPIRLFKADLVPVTRHVKIQGEANPYDPDWENYFEQRYLQKWKCRKWGKTKLRSIWKQQGGFCPMCSQGFNGDTSIHTHHIIERCKGGDDNLDNLVLLHPNCHRQVHHLMKLGANMQFVFAHLTAGPG